MSVEGKATNGTDLELKQHHKVAGVVHTLETLLFGHRILVLAFFAIASSFFAYQASRIRLDASYANMLPAHHPFIANYLNYENELRPLTNVVRIAVAAKQGDIYNKEYLETLKQVTDEVFFIPGVDRGNLKSLWTPNVLWAEVTEDGFRAGPIFPDGYDGSPDKMAQVRLNVLRSGQIGTLVAGDQRSAIVLVPLLEHDPQTGEKLNYGTFSRDLERLVRDRYQSDKISIQITGFAKIMGDLIHGARDIAIFFAITFFLTTGLVFAYSRCWKSTAATIFCCSLAVLWQLGIVRLVGYGLDPYSILVPFLTFAIGVSHAVQNINTVAADCTAGYTRMEAAQRTFRLLFIPGSIALLCDAVGFSTMMAINIGVIREVAISASIGVAVIIFTKMFLLPVLMSYLGISEACRTHRLRKQHSSYRLANLLSRITEPRVATAALVLSAIVLGGALYIRRDLKIGDLDRGAPELRPESRYNRDNEFIAQHYSTSPDVFAVMVKTTPGECGSYPVSSSVERLAWDLQDTPGVASVRSLFDDMKKYIAGTNGGGLRWYAISRNRYISNSAFKNLPAEMYNNDCSMVPVMAYLTDHKADTLARVVNVVQDFAGKNNNADIQFLLAAGNSGIDAATNSVIKTAEIMVLILVYGIVAALVLWEFRSWRVMLCIMIPLYITSVICEAIMAKLGLGVKVATLPVIALGIGIGVDYGIYIYNRLENFLTNGRSFKVAYFETLKTTGAAVTLTGITLALGVLTWIFSDIKFQADMGLLLVFMFLWNMLGAILIIPALASFLVHPACAAEERAVASADMQQDTVSAAERVNT